MKISHAETIALATSEPFMQWAFSVGWRLRYVVSTCDGSTGEANKVLYKLRRGGLKHDSPIPGSIKPGEKNAFCDCMAFVAWVWGKNKRPQFGSSGKLSKMDNEDGWAPNFWCYVKAIRKLSEDPTDSVIEVPFPITGACAWHISPNGKIGHGGVVIPKKTAGGMLSFDWSSYNLVDCSSNMSKKHGYAIHERVPYAKMESKARFSIPGYVWRNYLEWKNAKGESAPVA
jgi:hypothetical protein